MRAQLVPDKKTPLTAHQAIDALQAAYIKIVGVEPDAESLALLVSHSALETGNWKSIHCFNWGNVKASSRYRGLYCQFRCNERINGKIEWFDPPHPQTHFRAFKSAAEGAEDFISFLAVDTTPHNNRPNRYAEAWDALVDADGDDADVYDFCYELAEAGYYTAPPDLYYDGRNGRGGVLALYRQFMPTVEAFLGSEAHDTIPPETIETGDVEALENRIAELENWRSRISEAAAS